MLKVKTHGELFRRLVVRPGKIEFVCRGKTTAITYNRRGNLIVVVEGKEVVTTKKQLFARLRKYAGADVQRLRNALYYLKPTKAGVQGASEASPLHSKKAMSAASEARRAHGGPSASARMKTNTNKEGTNMKTKIRNVVVAKEFIAFTADKKPVVIYRELGGHVVLTPGQKTKVKPEAILKRLEQCSVMKYDYADIAKALEEMPVIEQMEVAYVDAAIAELEERMEGCEDHYSLWDYFSRKMKLLQWMKRKLEEKRKVKKLPRLMDVNEAAFYLAECGQFGEPTVCEKCKRPVDPDKDALFDITGNGLGPVWCLDCTKEQHDRARAGQETINLKKAKPESMWKLAYKLWKQYIEAAEQAGSVGKTAEKTAGMAVVAEAKDFDDRVKVEDKEVEVRTFPTLANDVMVELYKATFNQVCKACQNQEAKAPYFMDTNSQLVCYDCLVQEGHRYAVLSDVGKLYVVDLTQTARDVLVKFATEVVQKEQGEAQG